MQHGLLCLLLSTHGFAVSAMLDIGATWSFSSYKLAEKLLVTIQDTTPLTVMLPTGETLVITYAIKLDILIDDFIYI